MVTSNNAPTIRVIAHLLPWALALLTLAACRDFRRDNPVDPDLTPSVELSVALDDTAGTAVLNWTRYAGEAPFAHYLVLRRIAEIARWDTLAYIADAAQRSFLDTALAANTAYEYRLDVVNTSGRAAASPTRGTGGFLVRPVALLDVAINPRQGATTLTWSRFSAPRFNAYRIERRSGDQADFAPITRIEAAGDTTFTDSGLRPDVVYFYRVVVEAAGTEWVGGRSAPTQYGLAGVELLSAKGDADAGAIGLQWSRYGGPGFAAYRVLRRNELGGAATLLATYTDPGQTTHRDTTARASVDYFYAVEVDAADQQLESPPRQARWILTPVEITRLDVDAATASITLEWTPYQGEFFAQYNVVRRTSGGIDQVIATIEESTTTGWRDTGLNGDIEYEYQVSVQTIRGETATSAPRHGRFHARLASWPLAQREESYIRLYPEPEGVSALWSTSTQVKLLRFDAAGILLEERLFRENPMRDSDLLPNIHLLTNLQPRSTSLARSADGTQYLSLVQDDVAWVQAWSADGTPHRYRESIISGIDLQEKDRKRLQGIRMASKGVDNSLFLLDSLKVFSGDKVAFADDIESSSPTQSDTITTSADTTFFFWDTGNITDRHTWYVNSRFLVFKDNSPSFRTIMRIFNRSWQNLRWEGALILGDVLNLRISLDNRLYMNVIENTAEVDVHFFNEDRTVSLSSPVVKGVEYRMSLGVEDGLLSAWIQSPMLWSQRQLSAPVYAGLIAAEDLLGLVIGETTRTLLPQTREATTAASQTQISELRRWQTDGESFLGICQPQKNQVLYAPLSISQISQRIIWPQANSGTTTVLGTGAGSKAGAFIFPLSFAGSNDGRIYVLDAGNGRIQVFDTNGRYLTQWGNDGQFDFGSGGSHEDFVGSIAVDGDGFIYVADRRQIQKFAP